MIRYTKPGRYSLYFTPPPSIFPGIRFLDMDPVPLNIRSAKGKNPGKEGDLRFAANTDGALQQTYYDVHPYSGSVFFPDLRDLYELLIRNEAAAAAPASAYNHQMERKGGRSPSLRLRFGRRADPLWHADNPSDAPSN
ncbi:hypothetical protein TNCT_131081 [Trichonephila clavata]|uniref:Uncharacterized protein n=1 Tax=Trichonephila clavata TaxID=2740835 RepID=A0A8X6L972_TRICU|nr:hypothetical protein TNCT_131081 [Trichonephila clavata]